MVDRNDALLREVDEELRREQLEKLWQKYGTYAFAAAALIVVGVGGSKWLEARRQAAAEAAGTTYHTAVAALAAGKSDDAAKALSGIASAGPGGYALLSQLQLAGVALKAGNTADALKSFEEIGNSPSADRLLRGFAQLQAASLRMADADFTEMQNRLNDLTAADSPWRANAREMLGVAALKAGKTDEARKAFEQILGERNTPQSVIERARTYMSAIVAADLGKASPPAAAGDRSDAKDATKPAPPAN